MAQHGEYRDVDRKLLQSEPLHVHDLPQLYTRPSFDTLTQTLELLQLQPSTFSTPASSSTPSPPKINPEGIPRYLTSIISSSLAWLPSDSAREQIWELASARLSERSGRNAMPSMTRSFWISDELTIELFEPSLTEDHLGLKTWTSSLMLARRLGGLRRWVPERYTRVLELGSGTGLVGIAAARIWGVDVVLTDLPEIVPNLERNVLSNLRLFEEEEEEEEVGLRVQSLDWSLASDSPEHEGEKFEVIVAADPIYSADHPGMLVDAVSRWISRAQDAVFIVELPLRKGYEKERQDLRHRLAEANMEVTEEGTELGYDDWQGADGTLAEVECWWSVWKHIEKS